MVENKTMNHRQLIDELVRHCNEKESGTVFLTLHSGESARIVLNEGGICWMAFEQLRGEQAIEVLCKIDKARFSFNPLLKLAIGKQQLPSTSNIINRLYKEIKDPAATHDEPVLTEVASQQNTQDALSGDQHFSLDQVRLVLENEAVEYLGPVAKLLCTDYLKSMPPQLTHGQVRQLIYALKRDIRDEQKGQLFMERVKRALKIF
jgi:hypothetical protein